MQKDDSYSSYKEEVDHFIENRMNQKKWIPIWAESLAIMGIIYTLSYYAVSDDFFEAVTEWSQKHEQYELDEVIFIMFFFMSGFGVFLFRRLRDLKERIKLRDMAEKNIYRYVSLDILTGLPNRFMFEQNLKIATANLKGSNKKIAFHLIDLDDFKEVNDTCGHEVGDKLLKVVAERLKSVVGEEDAISRLSADEFIVIQNDIISPECAKILGNNIIDALDGVIIIDDLSIFVSVSIGTTICGHSEARLSGLIKETDIAMRQAKKIQKSCQHLYSENLGEEFSERLIIKKDLRSAIINEEFSLYYQPQFSPDNKLLGFEVLLRWTHPEKGFISPEVFIPIAEECGLIEFIDEWVLNEACKTAVNWDEGLTVAVNFSASWFKRRDLVERLKEILKFTGFNPRCLEVEITEGVLISDTAWAKKNILSIKESGAKVVMDDFGTGYSGLSYLREFSFDKIKIDRSFIGNLELEERNLSIIKAVVDLAKILEISVTAEGIETKCQKEKVVTAGCDCIQGYLLGRPMPLEEAKKLMAERRRV